jgi:hypothetical protein
MAICDYLGSNTLRKLLAEKSTRQAPFLEIVAGDGVHVADVRIAEPRQAIASRR